MSRRSARRAACAFSGTAETPVDAERARAVSTVRQAVDRRANGEPVHRIIGFREFYGLDADAFAGDAGAAARHRDAGRRGAAAAAPDVPQGQAPAASSTSAPAPAPSRWRCLRRCPQATAVGVDISAGCARHGARAMPSENGVAGRFDAAANPTGSRRFRGRFDVIVSNPPYIPTEEIDDLAARGARTTIRARRSMAARTGLTPIAIIADAGRATI